jgi:uncharacterized membrane protein YcaP (DUF421 family)
MSMLDELLGLSLTSEQLNYGHMAARAAVMYLALIVLVRSAKKRFLSNATAFDFILTVLVGAVAARAMTGGAPYFESLLAVAVLVAMHWLFSGIAQRSEAFSRVIKGSSTVLVADGEVKPDALRREHMSADDLREDLREKGVAAPADLAEARLERSGKLSVIKK